ncbi:hypothetical protein [Acinetobacter sp. MD2(2019)]|uniref:hypothetical protein n=1 Tax=Acinetobacter sp. MD2(2019) TaxID=2605273 RepID=UPI002D1EB188|nr:hypothetical protein [Acinetobacter sp. MD2(2019)]MEB3754915.1 hypothetical protein [Acinetobacter sp. MD2(2019)]
MNDLKQFYSDLKVLVSVKPIRPFVCSGNPLDSDILIVGFNPATETSDFWSYFDDEYGFHKERWLSDYKKYRKQNGKKTEVSHSRRVMEWICNHLELETQQFQVMETNIYSYPTARKSELSKNENKEVFDFILKNINPKLILTHGVDEKKYIETLNLDIPVISEKHFAIGWSRDKARQVANQIVALIDH